MVAASDLCLFKKCSEDLPHLSSTLKAAQKVFRVLHWEGQHRSPPHDLFLWPLTARLWR